MIGIILGGITCAAADAGVRATEQIRYEAFNKFLGKTYVELEFSCPKRFCCYRN